MEDRRGIARCELMWEGSWFRSGEADGGRYFTTNLTMDERDESRTRLTSTSLLTSARKIMRIDILLALICRSTTMNMCTSLVRMDNTRRRG